MTRSGGTGMVYDPTTGTWVPAPGNGGSSDSGGSGGSSDSGGSTNNPSSGGSNGENESEKKYIEAELNILTGEMQLKPSAKSIRIKVNDTVNIEGLGQYLSGLYFVSAINRSLSVEGGYTHSLTLIKNGFGDSVKKPITDTQESRKDEVQKSAYACSVGDSVKIVGSDAKYSNAHEGVKVPAWVKNRVLTVQKFSDDGTRVLLMPINSWTYIKNIQKV